MRPSALTAVAAARHQSMFVRPRPARCLHRTEEEQPIRRDDVERGSKSLAGQTGADRAVVRAAFPPRQPVIRTGSKDRVEGPWQEGRLAAAGLSVSQPGLTDRDLPTGGGQAGRR